MTDWGVSGVDLNGDGDLDVVLGGIETSQDIAGIGTVYPAAGETVNAGGSTATGAAYPTAITINGARSRSVTTTLTGGAGSDSVTRRCRRRLRSRAASATTASTATRGEDAVDYSASATAVTVTLGGGTAGVGSGEGLDSLINFEDIAGSSHGDTLTGDAGGQLDLRR